MNQTQIVANVTNSGVISGGPLVIIGGRIESNDTEGLPARLQKLILAFELQRFDFCICEWADRIRLQKVSDLPEDLEQWDLAVLYRARIFGRQGDLHMRRDMNCWFWNFIGAFDSLEALRKQGLPAKPFEPLPRKREQRHVLLWGEALLEPAGRVWFQDDRVGWADLDYPVEGDELGGNRVQLIYDAFLVDGDEAFVWWKDLRWTDGET